MQVALFRDRAVVPTFFVLVDTRYPEAAAMGEVLVRVTSVGLNRADLLFVQGRYCSRKPRCPVASGMEPAGIVERVGDVGSGGEFRKGGRVGVLPSSFLRSAHRAGLRSTSRCRQSCLVAKTPSHQSTIAGMRRDLDAPSDRTGSALKWLVLPSR